MVKDGTHDAAVLALPTTSTQVNALGPLQNLIRQFSRELLLSGLLCLLLALIAAQTGILNSLLSRVFANSSGYQADHLMWLLFCASLLSLGIFAWWRFMLFQASLKAQCETGCGVHHGAMHDELTDLPNRAHFNGLLAQQLASVRRRSKLLALYLIDLDHFKQVNDLYGHSLGDEILSKLALRLIELVGDKHMLARLGGDEFAVIQQFDRPGKPIDQFAQALLDLLSQPVCVNGRQFLLGGSVGVKVADGHTNPEELVRCADVAMYRAKSRGGRRYELFKASMDARLHANQEMASDLQVALKHNQLRLHFQPIYADNGSQLVGFEALLRWFHPQRGVVSPADFIPIAEEFGLINEIGDWVIHQACGFAVRWPSRLSIAVNVSPLRFRRADFVEQVQAALFLSGLSPQRLELEITESVLMENLESASKTLRRLKQLGVGIVMDDFGTGYSSLSYLRKLPFDKVKIDRSFISDITSNQQDAAIVGAIVSMSHSLGMTTTAEGVETQEQLDIARSLGCDLIQGYLLGRPMCHTSVLELLDNAAPPSQQSEVVTANHSRKQMMG